MDESKARSGEEEARAGGEVGESVNVKVVRGGKVDLGGERVWRARMSCFDRVRYSACWFEFSTLLTAGAGSDMLYFSIVISESSRWTDRVTSRIEPSRKPVAARDAVAAM